MRSFLKELDMVNGARQPLVLAFKEFVLDKSHGLEYGKKNYHTRHFGKNKM